MSSIFIGCLERDSQEASPLPNPCHNLSWVQVYVVLKSFASCMQSVYWVSLVSPPSLVLQKRLYWSILHSARQHRDSLSSVLGSHATEQGEAVSNCFSYFAQCYKLKQKYEKTSMTSSFKPQVKLSQHMVKKTICFYSE